MRILLQPPRPDAPSFEVDFEIQKALVALHGYSIKFAVQDDSATEPLPSCCSAKPTPTRALAALKRCRHPRLDDVAVAEVRPPPDWLLQPLRS